MKFHFKIFTCISISFIGLLGCSSQPLSLPDYSISPDSAECNLDLQAREGKTITFSGWATASLNQAPIGVAVKPEYSTKKTTTSYTKDMLERQDVANAFKNSNLLKTGFTIIAPSADFPKDSNIQIFAEGQEIIYLCKNKFSVK